jgi:hypothetical protein
MRNVTKLVRLFLTTLGVFTLLVSCPVIFHSVAFLYSEPSEALLGVSVAALVLGVLLAVGGTCLVFHGRKYENPRA